MSFTANSIPPWRSARVAARSSSQDCLESRKSRSTERPSNNSRVRTSSSGSEDSFTSFTSSTTSATSSSTSDNWRARSKSPSLPASSSFPLPAAYQQRPIQDILDERAPASRLSGKAFDTEAYKILELRFRHWLFGQALSLSRFTSSWEDFASLGWHGLHNQKFGILFDIAKEIAIAGVKVSADKLKLLDDLIKQREAAAHKWHGSERGSNQWTTHEHHWKELNRLKNELANPSLVKPSKSHGDIMKAASWR
ncbi:hypothetical protein LTS08_008114 [Lithohypha guttulata]|uniref:Uncharacterized protein n=1 Tax=Lithohypha guttulata TaxID=1690604 RepID=A0AAN7T3Z4_9EURO|nr:hypothetical protein LTR51_005037 [Lithohypha guttulata]KAK5087784.1 hypothetical protein LTR05_001999 [Lithohypha guttulata]KAK5095472.1 hypothetical protein LTS08_008114 [Lithohypha guttulata]